MASRVIYCLLVRIVYLTYWDRVTHICVGNLTIIGSDNGLSPGGYQAVIWPNAGILLIGPLGTNFSGMLIIEIWIFSFKKIHLKMSSGNCRPFCLVCAAYSLRMHNRKLLYGQEACERKKVKSPVGSQKMNILIFAAHSVRFMACMCFTFFAFYIVRLFLSIIKVDMSIFGKWCLDAWRCGVGGIRVCITR